ncbi:hypothetical protein QAD02_023023 [Eretmocerus hayati]|uniref:Uncharacterized protein n=1 Tax=Eretmocerus hayati TaxID=131215 RepID=A0ACC2PX60_9HYME|nr:hypothetical protein QAD02_023023 [Eretmocerus hayati]
MAAVIASEIPNNETKERADFKNNYYDDWYRNPLATGLPYESIQAPTFDAFLPSEWKSHVTDVISRGIGQFSLNLDQYLEITQRNNPGNLLFSPASLALALATILLASGGNTFNEISQVLGFDSDIDILNSSEVAHRIFGILIHDYDKKQKQNPNFPIRKVASGLFIQDGYPLRKQFKIACNEIYKTEVIKVDYARDSTNAKKVINKWVSNKTMNKIQEILTENPYPTTDIIFSSTLYFSGKWKKPFGEDTVRQPFTIGPNRTVYVDMMVQADNFPYYKDTELGLKIIGLPYVGSEVMMYLILPDDKDPSALRRLKQELTYEKLDDLIRHMRNVECSIIIPKMDLSSSLTLREALESLGLISLFDESCADLSLLSSGKKEEVDDEICDIPSMISMIYKPTNSNCTSNLLRRRNFKTESQSKPHGKFAEKKYVEFIKSHNFPSFGLDKLRIRGCPRNPGIWVGDIVHAIKMKVDQSGTEAASATLTLSGRIGSDKYFIANRPFLLFIRHNPSKNIWFWGTIYKPTPFYSNSTA